eukprot:jgi/Orpsp1_1/1192219/evm.model.d7180000091458.1
MKYTSVIFASLALISASISALATFLNERCSPGYGSCDPGYCCSQYGWGGNSKNHCGIGCQSEFGKCNDDVEKNCGPGIGNCRGNLCCSQNGYCGNTCEHCGTGCQSEFGKCVKTNQGNSGNSF